MKKILTILLLCLSASWMQAQITIGGNVYGGGNAGDMQGHTSVIIRSGDIKEVYGGARQADITGSAYVNIDGEHMSGDIIINAVYGGNDIAGKINSSEARDLTGLGLDQDGHIEDLATYNAFIHTSKERTVTTGEGNEAVTTQPHHIFVGQLFGGGNGDYSDDTYSSTSGLERPVLGKAYVDIHGGTFGYVYGGGNNATVSSATNICISNTSTRTKIAAETGGLAALDKNRLIAMGINTEYYNKTSNHNANVDKFLFSRVFGGNNKADMHIRPSWHLQEGSIENLYSGGNEGRMTSKDGLLLEIGSKDSNGNIVASNINVYNVYGGCRKADVCPEEDDGTKVKHVENIEGYAFPRDFAARVLVRSGDINNVYGGNDVRGKVYFGNAVGVYTNISGDIYGGGNGSYPYTDNSALANDVIYGDFYYNPVVELTNPTGVADNLKSVTALNLIRPDAEQVSIRVAGEANSDGTMKKRTIIGGSIYCGGNSATLKSDPEKAANKNEYPNYPTVELKIGSYTIMDKVFLGNNGVNMVDQSDNGLLKQYNGDVAKTDGSGVVDFSTIGLTDSKVFSEYMKGCAMDIIPSVTFDKHNTDGTGDPATYIDYTAYIGSFYCGGNVGSMTYNDVKPMNFNRKIIIFDKLVGGCNNAIIPAKEGVNAYYAGGLIGAPNSETGNKVELSISGMKIEPKRWKIQRNAEDYSPKLDSDGKEQYELDDSGNRQLEWNTIYASTGKETPAITEALNSGDYDAGKDYKTSDNNDLDRRFTHGHIYGGCYTSGIVNGNVVINIDGHVMEREKLFDEVKTDDLGEEESHYGQDQTQQERFKITERHTGVLLGQQGMDVLGTALNVFGGGKGRATEVWGSTTINLNAGYTFQVFGGSEEGVIGKRQTVQQDGTLIIGDIPEGEGETYTYSYKLKEIGTDVEHELTKTYQYNPAYSCFVNLKGENAGVSKQADQSEKMAECEFMYGGGFFGPICGNTYVNLGKGRIFNSFAGSCNADILGHTETYIGRQIKEEYKNVMGSHVAEEDDYVDGFPWVRDYTYGGNDLGGLIKQAVDFSSKVPADYKTTGKIHKNNGTGVLTANAYTEFLQGRAEGIFGGCYGTYDYTESKFREYFDEKGDAKSGYSKPYMVNAFVNFRPSHHNLPENLDNPVNKIYGAGQGYPGEKDRDNLQDRSYVLIDIPQDMTYYTGMEVFGAGAWGGVGMKTFLDPTAKPGASATEEQIAQYEESLDEHSTIIDLVRGQIDAVYGGSYEEGLTRRTVVNVPEQSTIHIKNIFGGAYGTQILPPCDVYESHVNYNNTSENARVTGAIFGGNNSERRTLYTEVNISSPVWSDKDKGYLATVYGAGKGLDTWAEYTEVNLLGGAKVYEVYGGSQMGHVLNSESVQKYMQTYKEQPSAQISEEDPNWSDNSRWNTETVDGKVKKVSLKDAWKDDWAADWKNAWTFGPTYDGNKEYYVPNPTYSNYIDNANTNLSNTALVRTAEMDDRDYTDLAADTDENNKIKARKQYKYNTNVIINQGAEVVNYAYGGGWGQSSTALSGDVYGETYIALLGGKVKKDIYAAGTSGSVDDVFGVGARSSTNINGFTASANAYIEGGTCRNVYGGGWAGTVGYHAGAISEPTTGDILGETHVVIGKVDGTGFINGIPAIERNAYGGGEGGAVFGTTNITLNKGFIGYRHFDAVPTTDTDLDYMKVGSDYYQEKLHDETWTGDGTNRLYDSGCIFGGGYIDNSSVDVTNVKMYGGHVRNALFGGGEIAAVGRGIINASGQDNSVRVLQGIYKAGKANVELYEGHVHRNVFGGGRGYNNLGEGGTLYSDGYVFGQTEVRIYGGEIGTDKGMERGDGNVFGGGDIGYVYSAYEENGKLYVGIKDGDRYDDKWEGYYYAYKKGDEAYIPGTKPVDNDPNWVKDNNEYVLTEDCKVLIEPHPKALSVVEINGNEYEAGQYVPITDLNILGNKKSDSKWNSLDPAGIIIHNAVFAGGNTSPGSSAVYANTTTVFGNATASINDAYHRDLITLGTGHTGGLYGDGNLTFVDGYRGLNITNYGTDYYSIAREITISEYENLPDREAAYYELRYQCTHQCTDNDGTTYYPKNEEHTKASTLTADDIYSLFKGTTIPNFFNSDGSINTNPNTGYWKENGVLPVYAGRPMNTIQRADFCGVFGSRMVMQGAQDRVPEIVDHTNYTINRVREVSLNQKHSVIGNENSGDLKLKSGKTKATNFPEDQNPDDFEDIDKAVHGNYFGIYNIVNYLGALTSDVHFMANKDIRRTDNADTDTYGPTGDDDQTYYGWKSKYVSERKRNNGISLNKVALASGVYLELFTEKVQGTNLGLYEKDWGYITGVIELDLINVQAGIGGGFVYAKNEHRVGEYQKKKHTTLTALNADAITRKDFTYNGELVEWETSGNFVHGTQIIIDDCYNVSGKYKGTVEPGGAVPAHYWFIKGSVYVYDQYISAYTGAPNAYSESVDIPLTITAASHGTMKLLNVMPNKYAYFSAPGVVLQSDKKMVINDVEYRKNDPISYWDWYLLTSSEKSLFVDETYVTIADCTVGADNVVVANGNVMLPGNSSTEGTYEYYKNLAQSKVLEEGKPAVKYVHNTTTGQDVAFDFVFRSSNNMSHDTGYMLTYKVNNPEEWDTWYTKFESATAEKKQKDNELTGYEDGPTYHLKGETGGVFGQRDYKVSNLISKEVYDNFENKVRSHVENPDELADFKEAYIVTQEYTSGDLHLNVGSSVSATQAGSMNGYVAPAFICTSTIALSKTEFIHVGTRMTEAEKTAYYNRFHKDGSTAVEEQIAQEILDNIVPAYYCTHDGLYGGDYYEAGKNYRGLGVWCSMSKSDREKFTFNYDAFDLLIDPNYSKDADGQIIHGEGEKYQYDSAAGTEAAAKLNPAGYSLEKPVDYKATYNGNETTTHNGITLAKDQEYSREDYEKLPNEKRHYSAIDVKEAGNVYVVKSPFQVGNSPYAVGTIISASTYNSLGESDQANIATLTFTDAQKNQTFYFCRESYVVGENTEGVSVTSVTGSETYDEGATVPIGLVITSDSYNGLANWQTDFTIHGIAPTETSTLYVSRESDIFDLSKEKIITVVYQYDYEESDVSGTHVTPISERHVVNIHLQFKSGIPTVEDIKAPQIVLPGTFVGIREPHVTPGAYEVTGGGWKLFEKIGDAESHINGIEYTPAFDPLYWYQDGYYLAYYAKTYLGETYSNAVQVKVANYHDLAKVMGDVNHYYVDNPKVKRNSKIYINDYSGETPAKNGLDLLKDFYDLSLIAPTYDAETGEVKPISGGKFNGQMPMDEYVKGGENIEFILRTDIDHSSSTWTSIGDATQCFAGNLHGDGHHISGLTTSLFGNLCGNVYNLGVMGSFNGGGVADTGDGYVENCWVMTTGTPASETYAMIGNPTDNVAQQIENCYYLNTNAYKETADARPMPAEAFYNGTVAYNLNGFYLHKRFYDNNTSWSGTKMPYSFLTVNSDGTLSENMTSGSYPDTYTFYPLGATTGKMGYVENRFADGDFRYAAGYIPEDAEMRQRTVKEGEREYYVYAPIWPDDYLFFGQALNYGYDQITDRPPHQDVPSSINRSNGRVQTSIAGNRVYRAPAYFRSYQMDVAHFNPYAVFAKSKKDEPAVKAYENMTALDLTGYNDINYSYQEGWKPWSKTSRLAQSAGMSEKEFFFPPLLDTGVTESGLNGFYCTDLTRNLLVYTDEPGGTGENETPTASQNTANVVSAYLSDEVYNESDNTYHTVSPWDRYFTIMHGHWVYKTANGYTTDRDHFLVDEEDFNAPISYTFASGKRMWHQRVPGDDEFVDHTKGWQAICLPFSAEIVTTDVKGEITHFYSGSEESKNGTGTKIGHEYWLRHITNDSKIEPKPDGVLNVDLNYPSSDEEDSDVMIEKEVENTFLWDYYYQASSKHNRLDQNRDTYQDYYSTKRTYENYPLLTYSEPYIIGFPGVTYYEFDLSGNFTAGTTYAPQPEKLEKQTITFASSTGITIGVSDEEMKGKSLTCNQQKYTFKPNYLNMAFEAGSELYTLNAAGNSFDKVPAASTSPNDPVPDTPLSAFRPYFEVSTSGAKRRVAEHIIFDMSDKTSFTFEDNDPTKEEVGDALSFFARTHIIGVESFFRKETDVLIVNTSGLTINNFTIQPGETIETPVPMAGVYIIRAAGGKYIKKVVVK